MYFHNYNLASEASEKIGQISNTFAKEMYFHNYTHASEASEKNRANLKCFC